MNNAEEISYLYSKGKKTLDLSSHDINRDFDLWLNGIIMLIEDNVGEGVVRGK